jgi:hypothetical protein
MVKFTMGHANYQGSMTGENISGINLLDHAVTLTLGKGSHLKRALFENNSCMAAQPNIPG